MIKKTILFCTAILCLPYYSVYAQTRDTLYEIATWKGFASSAASYTWDDNTPKQLTDALPLFDRYGLKTTFFVITNNNPDWNGLKKAESSGHEVGSHTLSHISLSGLADSTQEKEQQDSQLAINNQLANKQCVTLAYPYCASGNKSITQKYYISARGCSGQIENKTPSDFLNISSIICGTQGAVATAQAFNSKVDQAAATNGWVVFLLHGINNDGGYSPVDSSELSQHLQYVHQNRNKCWVGSYGNVVRYIRERDASDIKQIKYTDSLISFSVTHPLDGTIYNSPLTIKRILPDGWQSISISQSGQPIDFSVTEDNGKKYLVMDVVPNAGEVNIKRSIISGIEDHALYSSFEIYPNPVNASSVIQFELLKPATISIELIDVSGKQIWQQVRQSYRPGMHHVSLDITNLHGVFYMFLYVNDRREVKVIQCGN